VEEPAAARVRASSMAHGSTMSGAHHLLDLPQIAVANSAGGHDGQGVGASHASGRLRVCTTVGAAAIQDGGGIVRAYGIAPRSD